MSYNVAAGQAGQLELPALTESSGIVASRRYPGLYWTHNDSGDAARLYAATLAGQHVATVELEKAVHRDWEDVAAFVDQDAAWILIADIGDNRSQRSHCTLYLLQEPELDPASGRQRIKIAPVRQLDFVYEDGPRDAEAIAVDPVARQILIITKRLAPPVVYILPLNPVGEGPLIARRAGHLNHLPVVKPSGTNKEALKRALAFQPTAMDLSPNRRLALVVTYSDAFLYYRGPDETWPQAFQNAPERVTLPARRQGESGCFSADGQAIIVGTEGRPAPLWHIPLGRHHSK